MLMTSAGVLVPSASSLADRTPQLANSNYYTSRAVELTNYWADYAAIYRYQLWVRTIVDKLARGHARLPFGARVHDDKGGFTPENGPLDALLKRPNYRMSPYALWRWVSSTRDVYGEAFLIKLRVRGVVRELWPMHPSNVTVRRTDDGSLEYVYTAGRLTAVDGLPTWSEDDVIAFTEYNPENMNRGVSRLEALRMTLINEDSARRATAAFWRNGARPGVILQHPKELGGGALERLRQQFDAGTAGPDGTGRTKILEEGMVANVVQLNLEEMQYIESRKISREEFCAVYDVAPPAVHILDHATFSNITEQLRGFYRDTMAPRNEDFESVIDTQLVPDFYPDGSVSSWFDMDEVLRGDFETRADRAVTLRQSGILSGNESRQLVGFQRSDDPEMDKLYANAALVPLGSNPHAAVDTEGNILPTPLVPAKQLALQMARPQLTARSLHGRLSRVKAQGLAATKQKLIEEHQKELRAFFARQKAAVLAASSSKAPGIFDPADWDEDLATTLRALSSATTKTVGTATAKKLGGEYDESPISDWLDEDATESAKNLNATTAAAITKRQQAYLDSLNSDDGEGELDLGDELDDLFDNELGQRADEISLSRVSMLAGFASLVAAGQSDAKTKTWVVTSANPRASHAAMDGETVDLNTPFSNGMDGPGDFTGGADEVAGCTCELEFNL